MNIIIELAQILGRVTGIYLAAIFFNFVFRLITDKNGPVQRTTAAFVSTAVYIAIPILIANKTKDTDAMWWWVGIAILGWFFSVSFFALKLKLKQFLSACTFGIIFFIVFLLLLGITLGILGIDFDASLLGVVSLGLAFSISPLLAFRQKLPWTKIISNR